MGKTIEIKPSKKLFYIYLTHSSILFLLFALFLVILLDFPSLKLKAYMISTFLFSFLVYAAWAYNYILSMKYALTDKGIIWEKGVLFKNVGILPYSKVLHIQIIQSPIDRFFGVYTIIIKTSEKNGTIKIEGVKKIDKIRKILFRKITKES